MYSLGVDIGGTGCKCAAFSPDGVQRALAYSEYGLPAGSEKLPAQVLQQHVFQVIRQCAAQLPDPTRVAVITVSSFGESFVALDEDGAPLDDILLYFGSDDTAQFSRLVEQVGAETFTEITRLMPDPAFSLAHMLYVTHTAARPVWKYLFIASYLCCLLTGETVCDISLACRSLLCDVAERSWSTRLLEAAGIDPRQLPEILPTGSPVGTLLPEAARALGLPQETLVVIGAHDQIVNALGAGVARPGEAADISGTCECITPLFSQVPQSSAFLAGHFACVPYLDTGGYVTYAYNVSAGSVVRWFRDCLGGGLRREAEQAGKSVYDLLNDLCPDAPTQLLVLPFLQGMGGTPDVDPGATGLIAGLTTRTRIPDLYRALLEGITLEMQYNQSRLAEAGIPLRRLLACGGGARSAVWLQIKADILGCEIVPLQAEEIGAMGSAILGLAAVTGASVWETARPFRQYGTPYYPDPARQAVYARRCEAYCRLRALWREF